jgi:hypothetical protein
MAVGFFGKPSWRKSQDYIAHDAKKAGQPKTKPKKRKKKAQRFLSGPLVIY